jgi:cytochrome bd ubiquinol oxidase subunit II
VFPLLAVSGIASVAFELRRRNERRAFLASSAYLTGMLTSVVFSVYPMVLPARNIEYSLTVTTAKAGDYGLEIGLVWWIVGMILAAAYSSYAYRFFAGKVAVEKDPRGQGS